MTKKRQLAWAAGVWNQITENDDGVGLVVWSRHTTRDLAERAARRYARDRTASTGGPLSWCGGVRAPDGSVRWLHADGRPWGSDND